MSLYQLLSTILFFPSLILYIFSVQVYGSSSWNAISHSLLRRGVQSNYLLACSFVCLNAISTSRPDDGIDEQIPPDSFPLPATGREEINSVARLGAAQDGKGRR